MEWGGAWTCFAVWVVLVCAQLSEDVIGIVVVVWAGWTSEENFV